MTTYVAADLKVLPLSIFAVVLAITLGITFWASRRTSDATSWALDVPASFSVPVGFLCCWLATLASSEPEAERRFDELYVRSETGYGAEVAAESRQAEEPVAAS